MNPTQAGENPDTSAGRQVLSANHAMTALQYTNRHSEFQ